MEALAGEEFDEADLAGVRHMDAAAGAKIHRAHAHQPHGALNDLFASVGKLGKGFPIRPEHLHGQIRPDGLVGLQLQGLELLVGEEAVEVDGHGVAPHVKAHVVQAIVGEDQSRDDVLAAVLLHEREAPVIVEDAGDRGAHRQRLFQIVDDFPVHGMDVGDGHAVQRALIAGLAAALGVEGRAVEHHVVAVLACLTGEHLRRKRS